MDWLSELVQVLKRGERVALAGIITTSGSTPAAAFSKMIVFGNGLRTSGTVGGGCMEANVKKEGVTCLQNRRVRIRRFHLNEHEMVQGLICGGSLEVMTEPVGPELLPLFELLKEIRGRGEESVLATEISADGELKGKHIVWTSSAVSSEAPDMHVNPSTIYAVHHRNMAQRLRHENGEIVLEPIASRPRLLIFGGGHISKAICVIASSAGFRVTIIDDRQEYANPERFPDADETMVRNFAEPGHGLNIAASTSVVIVTRGHRCDEDVLEQVATSPAQYIGMIGSKRKVLATYENLLKRGVSVEVLEKICAPMGLEIGAVTAEEIAISIVAELIRARRSPDSPSLPKSLAMRSLIANLKGQTG